MKRCEFLMPVPEHKQVMKFVMGTTASFSDFVRQAIDEKLGREHAVSKIQQAKEELDLLVQEMRDEIGRTRRDLMDDNQRSLEMMRQDIVKSFKKNEEATKQFLMLLGAQASPEPASRPSRSSLTPGRSEDGPLKIPG